MNTKMQQIEISESDEPSKERIWDKMYQCRDFELSNFWQKSVFLFGFMALCFGGYGALVLKVIDTHFISPSLSYIYQYMCGISLLGIILSILWVYMAKGSKAWYEVYEKSIYAIEKDIFKYGNSKYIMGEWAKRMKKDVGLTFWDNRAGAFSPSKINMVIGRIMIVVWSLCFFISFYNLDVCSFFTNVDWLKLIGSVFVTGIVVLFTMIIRTFIKSKPFLPKSLQESGGFKKLYKEYNYEAFLPTIREKLDSWVEKELEAYRKDKNHNLDFSDDMKNELMKLIKNEIEYESIDNLYAKYESERTSFLNRIINKGIRNILSKLQFDHSNFDDSKD